MTYEKVEALGQILGCYFHQDWPDEFDGDVTALQAIIDTEPREQIQAVATEIEMLLAAALSEDQLKEILVNKVGCYFDPKSQGATYEQWLRKVHEKFSQV